MQHTLTKKAVTFTAMLCSMMVISGILTFLPDIRSNSSLLVPIAAQGDEPTVIECEIKENQSVSWMGSYILFNITTDEPFTLYYSVYGVGESTLKIVADTAHEVIMASGSNLVKIPIRPGFDTFPGQYIYDIILTYFNSSSGDPVQQTIYHIAAGEIQLMMGIPVLLIMVGVLFAGLFIVLIREEHLKKEEQSFGSSSSSSTSSGASNISSSTVEVNEVKAPALSTKPGFIKCAECKKEIKEGSSFCPECGYHIPKFLRN
jgi:hypothetical protein